MVQKSQRSTRINPWALSISSIIIIAGLGAIAWIKSTQSGRLRAGALAQVSRLTEEGNTAGALRHLNRYLSANPTDIPSLEVKARLLADSARDTEGLREAALAHERLLRLDPKGPGRQATRRKAAELYIAYSDALRGTEIYRTAPDIAFNDLRYGVARVIAREMIEDDPADASGHRLLGMALEASGSSESGDSDESVACYERALQLDPRDLEAAAHLAFLARGRMKDPGRADRVLDALLGADPDRVEVRLARFRHYAYFDERDRAKEELAIAVKLAPADTSVRLSAAEYALRLRDPKAARAHLDAIPASLRDSLGVRMIRGRIDLAERRVEDAIDVWRDGLARTGGSDAEMSWWLAYILLQLDQVAEAGPLVNQYARLVGDEAEPRLVLLRAILDEKAGRPIDAIARLDRLKDKSTDSVRTMIFQVLGRCHEALWDTGQALGDYREAAASSPNDAAPRLAVARLLEAEGEDEAVAYLRGECQAKDADPALLAALAETLLRRQARLPAPRRAWGEADAALARLAAIAPDSPSLFLLRADRRLLAGDASGAAAGLEAATRSAPRDAEAWLSYARLLDRQDKPEAALAALKAAAAPSAAGDRAPIRIAEARLLTGLGRGREARARLVRDLDALTVADRAAVKEELGRLLAAQGDLAGAREAFEAWASLTPDNPLPRFALLDLAVASDDDAQVRSAVASLRSVGGAQDVAGRLARVVEILRAVAKAKGATPAPDTAEASRIIEEIRRAVPDAPAVSLLNGQLLEGLDQIDAAAAEYRRAWDRGLEVALPRLVALLARHRRVDDLAALRRDRPNDARLERFLAQAARQLGDGRSAQALIGSTGGGDKPETRGDRAEALAAVGKLAEAEALLRKRAEESGGAEGPWLDLLRFQVGQGRAEAARGTIATIKERAKSAQPGILEAACLTIIGDRAGAERAISAALKARPDDPEILVAAASLAQAAGRGEESVARLKRALEIDPKREGLRERLAIASALSARDLDGWKRAWDALGPESSDTEARLARAFVLIRCPDPARRREAIPLLEALLADLNVDDPSARQARNDLVPLLLAEGQAEKACRVAEFAATRDGKPEDLALYAGALLRNRDFAAARKQLDRWHAADPLDRGEAALRAKLIRAEGPPEAVAPALERAYLDRGEGPAAEAMGVEAFDALFDMGAPGSAPAGRVAGLLASRSAAKSWAPARIAAREGRRDEALKLARTAVDLGTRADAIEATRAAMEVATAPSATPPARDAAFGLMGSALKRWPHTPEILVVSGMLRHLQGRYDDEAVLYRAALEVQPGNPIARNNLAWVLSESLARPADGLPFIDALIRDDGPDGDRLSTRGVILMRLGRSADAIRDLEGAAKLQPSRVTSYYLALAYRKAGRAGDAARTLADAHKAGMTPAELDPPHRAEYHEMVSSTL